MSEEEEAQQLEESASEQVLELEVPAPEEAPVVAERNGATENVGLLRYFTPREVAAHNTADNCWVSIFYRVFNLTRLIKDNRGVLTQPLVLHAGEDISHWFDKDTLDVKKHMDPARELELPFVPYGRFLHVPPPEPTADWNTADFLPWWQDATYVVGKLTKRARWIELVNVLTQQRHDLQVCCEETIEEIRARYQRYNAHAGSYTWKYLDDGEFVPLHMKKTLDENGITDDADLLERLDMDEQQYKPSIYLYFNDDLSVA